MYDRSVFPIPEPAAEASQNGLSYVRYRFETLVGITGYKMAKYRLSWTEAILSPLKVVWRPHLLIILIFEVGFGVRFAYSILIDLAHTLRLYVGHGIRI
jgi:hypothetical protein